MSIENWSWGKDKEQHVELETARAVAEIRRAAIPAKMLHHNAYRCIDAEETRYFYEDMLGMPLVAALYEPLNAITGEPDPYVHLYFELADGSTLAFFDYPGFYSRENAKFESHDPYFAHIALEVEGKDIIQKYKKIYEKEGVEHFILDHQYCYSLYCYDPNGMVLEFTTNVPISEQFFADAADTAHDDLKRWMEKRKTVIAELEKSGELNSYYGC